MLKNDWLRMAAVLASLWLAPLGSYARQQSSSQQDSSQQTGDPVADAARKARDQKEKKNAPKRKKRRKRKIPKRKKIQTARKRGANASLSSTKRSLMSRRKLMFFSANCKSPSCSTTTIRRRL